MGPKVSVFVVNTILMILILACSQSSAKPFFNPFNFAISTDFKEDGNTFSITYPKNSRTVSFKFHSDPISENKFDFPGLLQAIARKFTRKFRNFNPFQFSSMTTRTASTTEDPNFTFSAEVTDDDHYESSSEHSVKSSSTEEPTSEEETSSEDTETGVAGNGYKYSSPPPVESSTAGGYAYEKHEVVEVTTNGYKYTPPTVYLPPKLETPATFYLPHN